MAVVKLSESEVLQYQRDGAVLLKNVFPPYWTDKLSSGIEENRKNPSKFAQKIGGNDGGGIYFHDYFNWRRIEEFEEFVFDSPAAETAAKLMGENER